MALSDEKARITREVDAYLRGRHDKDKKHVATSCKAAVALALNYGELLRSLEAYRAELTRLVGKKNASRWFSHKAGGLEKVLADAIGRCRIPAANEAKAFAPSAPARSTTVKDWRRHGDGKSYLVNGRRFTNGEATIEDIAEFFELAGITSRAIREYLCDHANQDGLFGTGHLFYAASMQAGAAPSFSGMRHEYRGGAWAGRLKCRDEFLFSNVVPMLEGHQGGPIELESALVLVQTYALVEDDGEVVLVDPAYHLDNLDAVPEPWRGILDRAFETVDMSGH